MKNIRNPIHGAEIIGIFFYLRTGFLETGNAGRKGVHPLSYKTEASGLSQAQTPLELLLTFRLSQALKRPNYFYLNLNKLLSVKVRPNCLRKQDDYYGKALFSMQYSQHPRFSSSKSINKRIFPGIYTEISHTEQLSVST
jgi:hypothetical protein